MGKDKFILIRCGKCGCIHACCYENKRHRCTECEEQVCYMVDIMAVVHRICDVCKGKLTFTQDEEAE
ncbi:MAG: hypothetical protein DRG30_09620 [Epsilonproteobacteria bacterium]|nr:MAG: hypothetical protein DRG30_09620 [Campylobacterota bacterium]